MLRSEPGSRFDSWERVQPHALWTAARDLGREESRCLPVVLKSHVMESGMALRSVDRPAADMTVLQNHMSRQKAEWV